MQEKTYEVTEGGKFGLEIRLDISEDELKRIMRSLNNYRDQVMPGVTMIHSDESKIFRRSLECCDNPEGVYFVATKDKGGVQSIVRGKDGFYEVREEVLRFGFAPGDRTRDYIDRFLESIGYKNKEKLDEAQRKEAKIELDRGLRPAAHSSYQKRPKKNVSP
jgi:hypothetical protein